MTAADLAALSDGSSWVATPLRGTGDRAPASPMLRRSFDLAKRPRFARLVITALGLYEPWLNGQRVGDLELRPGWTDFNHRVAVQAYDVAEQLAEGPNVLGAWLGDGWYSGKVAHLDRGLGWGAYPRLRAVLLGSDDGVVWETLVATDDGWRWHSGPILSSDLFDGEDYDARREVSDWSMASGDDSGWEPVEVDPAVREPEFVISQAPPVRVIEELKPVAEPVEGPAGWGLRGAIFDFGQNFTGKVRLAVRGPAGATLTLRYAEVLTPDGTALDTSNLRRCRATDTYTLRGDPAGETWTPRFTFHGFRYAAIECHENWRLKQHAPQLEPFTSSTLTGLVMHNDMTRTGTFATGHALVDRLHQNIVWGLRSNFLEVPTDCPQRNERLGWTGDAQIFAPTASYLYDTVGFFGKWIDDLADAQLPDGAIPRVAPNILPLEDSGGGWSDAVVIVPWEAYRASGRRELIETSFDTMRRWVDYQLANVRDGVRGDPEDGDHFAGFGDWLAIDTDSVDPFANATPRPLAGTAYLAHSLSRFVRIARILGRDRDAADAEAAHASTVDAFRRLFVDGGRVTVRSQTAHLMALAFDLVEPGERAAVFGDLLELLAERDHHLSTGFLGTPLWCDVLTREGRVDLAYNLLLNETYPGWLFPVTLGATTMWERWNSWHPERGFVDLSMNSLNHYAYGAVGDWMHRTIAGIDLDLAEDTGPSLRL
ncbi:MAG: family 78 glycoside hydrolase catalytic domain, partial [Planctomycetota bacterium]